MLFGKCIETMQGSGGDWFLGRRHVNAEIQMDCTSTQDVVGQNESPARVDSDASVASCVENCSFYRFYRFIIFIVLRQSIYQFIVFSFWFGVRKKTIKRKSDQLFLIKTKKRCPKNDKTIETMLQKRQNDRNDNTTKTITRQKR